MHLFTRTGVKLLLYVLCIVQAIEVFFRLLNSPHIPNINEEISHLEGISGSIFIL